jgi:small subunit ribosomal protein S8
MTDPITDMLNQIRNSQAVKKTDVLIPFSNLKNEIASILSKENFLGDVKKISKGKNKMLKINLKYENGTPIIDGLRKISKPGQRIYVGADDIKKVRGGFGVSIISTPKGLMTGKQAKRSKLGGEILIEVW